MTRPDLALVLALLLAAPAPAQEILPFDPEYAPLSYVTEAGEPAGFDVDVARAIAGRIGMEAEFRPEFFSVIRGGGWPPDWAFTVSSMSRSPEREQHFDFVGPYYFDAVVVVAPVGSPAQTLADVRDARIGICAGCIYAEFVAGTYRSVDGAAEPPFGRARIVTFPSETDMLQSLADPARDEVEFGITSIHKADYFIQTGRSLRKIGPPLFVEPVWIAVPKGRAELLPEVTRAFEALAAEGAIAELSLRHLGADYTAIGAPDG